MDYILGTALLFMAAVVLALGRLALNRRGPTVDSDTFGAAEAIAFVFTMLLAFGTTLMARKAIDDWSLWSFALMVILLAVAGGASAAVWFWLVRLASRTREEASGAIPAGPSAPDDGRRKRPTSAGGEGKRATRAKRAA